MNEECSGRAKGLFTTMERGTGWRDYPLKIPSVAQTIARRGRVVLGVESHR